MGTIDKAIEIAAAAHAGMKDRHGEPYILHPIRVMLGVEGEDARIVAILHDVVEDTDTTFDDIRDAGFSQTIIDALRLVTHGEHQSYSDYVIACKANEIALQVKLADLRDNADLNRLLLRPEQLDADAARLHRYVLSYRFLTDDLSELEYRHAMNRIGISPV